MIKYVHYDKPLILISAMFLGEARLPSSGSEYNLLRAFGFIKAVSDTVLDMINDVYHDKPLIFIGATFRKKLVSHHQAVNITC